MTPDNRFSVIMMSHKEGGKWQQLEVAPFSGEFADLEPMFDPSGKKLFFSSKRPRPDRAGEDWDIWVTTREKDGWSEPENLGAPVNSTGNEFYPSIASNGNLYFTTQREGGVRAEDIYRAMHEDGKYLACVPLGQGVNSKLYEFNAFVTPDESAIIFSSQGREGEFGGGDLYISRRGSTGEFGPAELLPEGINSTSLDYCPFLWHGMLYFTSALPRMGTHRELSSIGKGDPGPRERSGGHLLRALRPCRGIQRQALRAQVTKKSMATPATATIVPNTAW